MAGSRHDGRSIRPGGGQRARADGLLPLRLLMAAGARPHRRGLTTLLAAALISLGPSLLAQDHTPAHPPTLDDGRPVPMAPAVIDRNDRGVTVRATRITTAMVIDGRLDEPVYEQIRAITEFEQQAPKEGAPVSEPTEAWVFYDDKNLYVACRCRDADPSRIVANDMRRDSINLRQNDNFGVMLDTFHDRRNGYLFYVSPVGGMFDGATSDERNNNADWNTVWLAKATRSDQGWFAEIAIPFKSLRYRAGREQTWGIILRRTIRGKNEYAYITPIKPQWGVGAFFRSSAAATLIGLEAPPAAKNFEIKPYATSRLTTDMLARPAVRNDVDPDVGVDVKYGITKGLTADFTYNTDFAQVEADEVQVNLTRFNLQFPEKRDFFLEGQGIFTFGTVASAGQTLTGVTPPSGASDAPTIFYSRRIGLGPSGAVPIVAGARVSGRAGRFTIGALNITSDDDPLSRGTNTNFTVLRLRRDVLRRGTIGGLFTNRSVSLAAPNGNQVFGADSSFGFYQNVYLSGYVSKTRTSGRNGDDVSYRGNFNYAADRYGFQADRTVVGDNFTPEVGFLPRRAFRRNFTAVRFSPRPKQNQRVRQYFYETSLNYTTDNANRLESRRLAAAARLELQNSDVFNLEFFRDYELLRQVYRPAPGIGFPAGGYDFHAVRGAWSLGQQHPLSGTMALEIGQFYDGTKRTASMNARYGISRQLGVEPNLSMNWVARLGERALVAATGARTTFTMTPRMFVAALVQYASSSHSLTTNLRFRWEYQPGSELFVVYSDGHDTVAAVGVPALQNRGLVVKFNKLLRF